MPKLWVDRNVKKHPGSGYPIIRVQADDGTQHVGHEAVFTSKAWTVTDDGSIPGIRVYLRVKGPIVLDGKEVI